MGGKTYKCTAFGMGIRADSCVRKAILRGSHGMYLLDVFLLINFDCEVYSCNGTGRGTSVARVLNCWYF